MEIGVFFVFMNFTCSKVWIEKWEFTPFLMAGSPENEGLLEEIPDLGVPMIFRLVQP